MNIEKLRKQIDIIDDKILRLLHLRNNLAKKIGKEKKSNYLQVQDAERENELVNRIKKKSDRIGLDKKYVTSLYKIIINNSKRQQR